MKRILGKSGIEVSALGLGCWPMGGFFSLGGVPDCYGEVDDEESIRAVHTAVEAGVTFFDTADVYGAGHSERVLGRALKGRREDVVIATKFGFPFDEESRKAEVEPRLSNEYIEKALKDSLARLGTDYIDLYLIHAWSMASDQIFRVLDKLEELSETGRIRAFGWSTDLPEAVSLVTERPHGTALEFESNLFVPAGDLHQAVIQAGLAGLIRSPLGMGLLSGKYGKNPPVFSDKDVRAQSFDWNRYFCRGVPNGEFLKKLEALRDILTADGRTLVQGALAWLWAQSPAAVPLPGFRNSRQALENARSMEKGPLSVSQMEQIRRIISPESP
jgi:aryl-alcohol dehydrogenase-like predicted oxidoreductase